MNNAKKSLVPHRRFKEFQNAGAWEQRKLGDIVKISTGFPFDSDSFTEDGNYLVITNGNIQDNSSIVVSTIGNHISVFDEDIISKYVLNVDDILVTMDGTVGRTAKVSKENMILAQRVGRLKATEDSEFIYQLLNAGNFSKDMLRKSHGGTIKHISLSEISSFETLFPVDKRERSKIGNHFKQLDTLIALHQRKLNKLKKLKSAYLTEMFPAEGEHKPKRRFAGFTDDWEQRKLGEVAKIVGGGTPSTKVKEYWDGDINWYSPVEIGNSIYASGSVKRITELGLEKSSAKILPKGTVLFTSRAGIGNTAILSKEAATNQGFQSIVPKKKLLDSYFIFTETPFLKKYGEINGAGSTFVEVSGKQMAKMPLRLPLLEEQKKIGVFFKQIDSLIALHQRKIDKLQKLKNAYLNEMFV